MRSADLRSTARADGSPYAEAPCTSARRPPISPMINPSRISGFAGPTTPTTTTRPCYLTLLSLSRWCRFVATGSRCRIGRGGRRSRPDRRSQSGPSRNFSCCGRCRGCGPRQLACSPWRSPLMVPPSRSQGAMRRTAVSTLPRVYRRKTRRARWAPGARRLLFLVDAFLCGRDQVANGPMIYTAIR